MVDQKVCPDCGKEAKLVARDFHRTSHCENGHTWHICAQHERLVSGKASKTFPECTCDPATLTAEERSKLEKEQKERIYKTYILDSVLRALGLLKESMEETSTSIHEFLVEFLSEPFDFGKKEYLEILKEGSQTLTYVDKTIDTIRISYYGSAIEWGIYSLRFIPEHGEAKTIIRNDQIRKILNLLRS